MCEEDHIFEWGHSKRYNDFPNYIKTIFSERIQKVSVDAGFTCPNRDGTKGVGGCSYCNNATFKPTYCNLSTKVSEQLERGIKFFERKKKSMNFLAYFQAYSNTYAPLNDLKLLYEEALAHPKVIGLVIATRPDILPDDVLDYLEEKSKSCYVMVELGVESCEEDTLLYINRGHTFAESEKAIRQLANRGIHSCVHMILGLPGEDRGIILKQAIKMSQLPFENIKLHQLQIHKQTMMSRQYAENPELFNLFDTVEEYLELVIDYLELLNPSIVVERFVSQSPADLLIAPKWGLKNFEFVAKIDKRLQERDAWQGRLYNNVL